MRKIARRYVVALLGSALLGGCDEIFGPVDHVNVYGFRPVLVVGQQQRFSAGAFNDQGNGRPSGGYRWRSSNPAVASVASDGTVTAHTPGLTEIQASAGGATGRLLINVVPPISAVRLKTRADTLVVGDTSRVVAEAFDVHGARVPVAWFTFNSSDARIIGVGSEGALRANGATGKVVISAELAGKSDSVVAVVVPRPNPD